MEKYSRLEFSNNEIITIGSNNVALIESAPSITAGGKYTFSSNCVSPSDSVIYSGDSLKDFIRENSFTVCTNIPNIPTIEATSEPTNEETNESTNEETNEPTNEETNEPTNEDTNEPTNEETNEPTNEETNEPTNEETNEPTTTPTEEQNYCENMPINSIDISKQEPSGHKILYTCDHTFNKRIANGQGVFQIYHCNFNSIHNLELNGGAIYLNTDKNSISKATDCILYKCTFENCQSKRGGAIYIITTQISRFHNISNCTFKSNQAVGGESGAIHFEGTSCTILGCEFINNAASKGGSITYNDNAGSDQSTRKFLVQYNKFERSSSESLSYLFEKKNLSTYFEKN